MPADAPPQARTRRRFLAPLIGASAVVFLANAGLLVLQLVAGRLLSPFIGSSLETWTAVIGSFLAGIAVGNAWGGRMADRSARGNTLALFLALGGLATVWMTVLPQMLDAQRWHATVDIGLRIPLLALVLAFPAACLLSVLTPLAIRLGVPDVQRTGLVSGVIFGMSTLGCLLGNHLTGFVLIPEFTVNQIVIGTATLLLILSACTFGVARPAAKRGELEPRLHPALPMPIADAATLTWPLAVAVVFLCSFAGMTLELSATRLLAPVVGVSLDTWTGVIGVMLAGTSLGNWCGGLLAQTIPAERPALRRQVAAFSIIAAGVLMVLVLVVFSILTHTEAFVELPLVQQIFAWTFSLFFLPMLLLGTVSPQVIRLAVPNLEEAGHTAGRIYAWSTAGAILGTFATGYVLISNLGVQATVLIAAFVPTVAACLVANPWRNSAMLYAVSIVGGAFFGGLTFLKNLELNDVVAESNYYTIKVSTNTDPAHSDRTVIAEPSEAQAALLGVLGARRDIRMLSLDLLIHSTVDLRDPTYLAYQHEQLQLEAVYLAREAEPKQQNVLVIGGGGYTFPRCARTLIPTCKMDVVEIDPMVTKVAFTHLGLNPALGINAYHQDGRQFIAETARKGHYHVVTLDAVNDFSVPYHLLTKECNDAVKATLTADGVYLVTVIDAVETGQLWKAVYHTLKETYPHVGILFPKNQDYDPLTTQRSVIVLYASAKPLDAEAWNTIVQRQSAEPSRLEVVARHDVLRMLKTETKPTILTDQYAPVDHLMRKVFLNR